MGRTLGVLSLGAYLMLAAVLLVGMSLPANAETSVFAQFGSFGGNSFWNVGVGTGAFAGPPATATFGGFWIGGPPVAFVPVAGSAQPVMYVNPSTPVAVVGSQDWGLSESLEEEPVYGISEPVFIVDQPGLLAPPVFVDTAYYAPGPAFIEPVYYTQFPVIAAYVTPHFGLFVDLPLFVAPAYNVFVGSAPVVAVAPCVPVSPFLPVVPAVAYVQPGISFFATTSGFVGPFAVAAFASSGPIWDPVRAFGPVWGPPAPVIVSPQWATWRELRDDEWGWGRDWHGPNGMGGVARGRGHDWAHPAQFAAVAMATGGGARWASALERPQVWHGDRGAVREASRDWARNEGVATAGLTGERRVTSLGGIREHGSVAATSRIEQHGSYNQARTARGSNGGTEHRYAFSPSHGGQGGESYRAAPSARSSGAVTERRYVPSAPRVQQSPRRSEGRPSSSYSASRGSAAPRHSSTSSPFSSRGGGSEGRHR